MDAYKTHGAFSWFELMTGDVAKAREFYAKVFGWNFAEWPMEGGNPYTMIQVGEESIGGMMKNPPGVTCPPCWGIYVTVKDVAEAVRQVTANGGKVLVPPMEVPKVGTFSVFQDPQGAVISVMQYAG